MNFGQMLNTLVLTACAGLTLIGNAAENQRDFAAYVDPFIGTSGTGHTTPAACVPLGFVQAGPDTGVSDWEHTAGYVWNDKTILGFSQTHLSGTGCGDLGDVRLLPIPSELDALPEALLVDKTTETASPGFYAVTLGGIRTEITATKRAALYRFNYAKSGKVKLLVDTQWGAGSWGEVSNRVLSSVVSLEGRTGVSGTLKVRRWVKRECSFYLAFDRPFVSVTELPRQPGEQAPRYLFEFELPQGTPLAVKVALSRNNPAAARRNLESEIPGWDFNAVRAAAREAWNQILALATIEGSETEKKNWYTSLYHLYFQPNDISDVDEGKPLYSTFSTWDTFRAAGPLYTILTPAINADFVDSMLHQGKVTGFLPIWTLWGVDNQCMIGTHSIPMIVDEFLKNGKLKIENGKWEAAYQQIKETLTKTHKGRYKEQWEIYDRYGYYPFDLVKDESVSRTLECAYDDWCAAQMAKQLGKNDDYVFFMRRASYWKNLFDPQTRFVRGKDSQGKWRDPFNPYAFGFGHGSRRDCDYTEGNAFQYMWHVMQDVPGLVNAIGGREATLSTLESLFCAREDTKGAPPDVSGLIGQYVHGNEPSHHVIYFYPQLGEPHKAAERIREVFDRFYLPKTDGLCGNDDCGQMSAWYLFSAMGFYPFNPCGGEYVIGAPQVEKVEVVVGSRSRAEEVVNSTVGPTTTPKGNTFTIIAKNLSKKNKYVKSVMLNGKPITNWKIRHEDIMAGGTLEFEMVPLP